MIQINSTTPNRQPTTVTETTIPIQTDVTAIDGSVSRNFIQNKYSATMVIKDLLPTDYQQWYAWATATGIVNYYNDLSDLVGGVLSFNGLPTYKESAYYPGSSAMRDLTVVIRES